MVTQAVFDLSEAQIQDLMFLRRLNLVKRATLSAERKVLMHAMAASEAEGLRNRSDNLICLSRLATQLQQNTADDRQVYYKLARSIYRGVRMQHADQNINSLGSAVAQAVMTISSALG